MQALDEAEYLVPRFQKVLALSLQLQYTVYIVGTSFDTLCIKCLDSSFCSAFELNRFLSSVIPDSISKLFLSVLFLSIPYTNYTTSPRKEMLQLPLQPVLMLMPSSFYHMMCDIITWLHLLDTCFLPTEYLPQWVTGRIR